MRAGQPTQNGSTWAGPAHQVGVWVPGELAAAVLGAAAGRGVSVTTLFLEQLHGLELDLPPALPGPAVRRRRRASVPDRVQLWLYLSVESRAALDAAAARTRTGSRSAFVTWLLRQRPADLPAAEAVPG